jgi:hypothetical protein
MTHITLSAALIPSMMELLPRNLGWVYLRTKGETS